MKEDRAVERKLSLVLFLSLVVLSACGRGGGGGDGVNQAGPISALLTVSAEGSLPAGQSIGGIGFTINLPDGMNVKADSEGIADASAVATAGVAQGQATVIALYTGATATAQAKLYIVMASNNRDGFGPGDLTKINCGMAAEKNPHLSGISITDVDFRDTRGAVITGLTLTFQAVTQ